MQKIAIYLATKLKDPKLKYLRKLKRIIKQSPSVHPINFIGIKEDLNIEIERIGLSDIFFKEEFYILERGLVNLIDRHFSPRQSKDRALAQEELSLWFKTINKPVNYTYSSDHYLGYIDPHTDSDFKNLGSGYIYLKFISPSFVTLAAIFNTSDFFRQRFADCIHASHAGGIELSKFNPMKGELPAYEIKSPIYKLEEKVEELFSEVKESASYFFRKNLGIGLSSTGILPSFEILSCDFPLGEIPEIPNDLYHDLADRFYFLRGLGYPVSSDWTEVQKGYMAYETLRKRNINVHNLSYQLLLSISDLKATRHADINYGDPESIIESVIHEKVIKALNLLAIQFYFEHLHSKIMLTNKQLEPVLLGKQKISGNLKNIVVKIKDLNEIHCRSLSIFSFQEESLLWFALDVPNNKYLSYKDQSEKKSILVNLKLSIQKTRDLCEAKLSFLKTNYEQAASYQLIMINHKFQKIALLISIVTVILTFLAIPKEFRVYFWYKLLSVIENISVYVDQWI